MTNPTDSELNAAFAEKVAGYIPLYYGDGCKPFAWGEGTARHNSLHFTTSADAVLPWLEKTGLCATDSDKWIPHAHIDWMPYQIEGRQRGGWRFDLGEHNKSTREWSFAKAAVIALLRAHGVEVEFTP